MNFGTKTGNTVAFDIECLPKLIETRANSREQGTLLSFIISTMRANYPETLTWTAELADLKYAKNASSDKIDLNMRELKANLTLARSLATNITKFNEKDKFDLVLFYLFIVFLFDNLFSFLTSRSKRRLRRLRLISMKLKLYKMKLTLLGLIWLKLMERMVLN